MGKIHDLTGQRHGRLLITGRIWSPYPKRIYWGAQCDCGAFVRLRADFFGRTKSCGCLQKEVASKRATTHGMSSHLAYRVWKAMCCRCDPRSLNEKAQRNYIARGITVCDRWHTFELFWEDMGATYRRGLTLERRDNNKGYSPDNCIWATHAEQNRNRRGNVWIDTPRGRMPVVDAAKAFGLKKETLLARIRRGQTGEDLLAPPNAMSGDRRRTRWRREAPE